MFTAAASTSASTSRAAPRGRSRWRGSPPSVGDVRDARRAARVSATPRCSCSRATRAVGARPVEDLNPAEQDRITDALAEYGNVTPGRRERQRRSARPGATRSATRRSSALVVFFLVIALYLAVRFEMEDGRAPRSSPSSTTSSITVGVYAITGLRGHAGDRGRVPDHPRLLALRHRRRVRQDQGERGDARHRRGDTYSKMATGR